MRVVKYVDKKELMALGRFFDVKQGSKLTLTEEEFERIKDDPRFEDITDYPTKKEVKNLQEIQPLATPVYDLRKIDWSARRLAKRLESRKSIKELRRVVEAFRMLGIPLLEVDESTNRKFTADAIAYYALSCGWNKLTYNERKRLPILQTTTEEVQEEGAGEEKKEEENKEAEISATDGENNQTDSAKDVSVSEQDNGSNEDAPTDEIENGSEREDNSEPEPESEAKEGEEAKEDSKESKNEEPKGEVVTEQTKKKSTKKKTSKKKSAKKATKKKTTRKRTRRK